MTPEEIVEVVGLLAVAHGRSTSPETFEVYEAALGDLDVPDARALVLGVLRTVDKWPSPAALRRMILGASGLLALDEDEAWVEAARWATFQGDSRDRPILEDEVRAAVEAVGGSWGLRMGQETTVRAQFREAYRRVKARADEAAMARSWKGLPLNPGGQLQLTHGRDENLDPGGGRGPTSHDDRTTPGEAGEGQGRL